MVKKMVVGNAKKQKNIEIDSTIAKFTTMQVLVTENEGWKDYVMRLVEVGEGGYTPKHAHPWEHINFVTEGEGEIMIAGKINKVSKDAYAFIPPNTLHQFRNTGNTIFKFICIVPKRGHNI